MKSIEELIKEKYINNLTDEEYVGVEIEMPILNMKSPYKVDKQIVTKLFNYLLGLNYKPIHYDNEGECIGVQNIENRDQVTLEYSVNTLEFSLYREKSITRLEEKFRHIFSLCNNFFMKYNYKLEGAGINSNIAKIDKACLNEERYKVIQKILKRNDSKLYGEFCSYCCSIQTHINVSKQAVLDLLNMFTYIEDNKSILFANSYMKETGLIDSRRYLWRTSNFGKSNTGKNPIYSSIDDLINDYMQRTLLYVKRGDEFLVLRQKVKLLNYFKAKEVEAENMEGKTITIEPKEEDFDYFRSYRSVELTKCGTIEIRTDCTQKLNRIFPLVAFNVGVAMNKEKILKYIEENNYKIDNNKLFELAREGIKKRNKNEERYLENLNEENWFVDV